WHVQPGDDVVEDQLLADVMTDKATVQVPSPAHGKVMSLGGAVGDVMAVGSELIRLEVEGEGNAGATPVSKRSGRSSAFAASASVKTADDAVDIPEPIVPVAAPATDDAGKASPVVAADSGQPVAPRGEVAAAARPDGGKPLASPAVRKRAWDLGVELQYVAGTGPAGRISHGDLDTYLARGAVVTPGSGHIAAYVARNDEQQFPVIGLRRKIAQKMQDAKRR